MKGTVYILQSVERENYYVGSTIDIDRRLLQHERGHTSTTKRFGKCKLVFTQEYESIRQARMVEKKIKSWKRRDFIDKIIKDGSIKVEL